MEKVRSTGIFIHDPDPDRISAFVCISDVVFPLPVSYTHLRLDDAAVSLLESLYHVENVYPVLQLNIVAKYGPVSYTHLDVYKRQLQVLPAREAFAQLISKKI